MLIKTTRHHHAAHDAYDSSRAFDVIDYHCRQPYGDQAPDGVPGDAQKHHGYIDASGAQIVVWSLGWQAPERPACKRCTAQGRMAAQ